MGFNFSPNFLQTLTDKLVSPIRDLKIANYVDDFCMGAETFEQMLYKLRQLFLRIREFGLTLSPKKCNFASTKIKFLGHMLDANGIQPTDENLIKIQNYPRPTTVRKVRRYLGICNYYRRLIKDYNQISAPLTELTKKRNKFTWTEKEQQSFDTLKEKLGTDPIILKHPNFEKEFILITDASDICVAGTLGQADEFGIIHPISFYSRKLSASEQKFSIAEKELLSVVNCVEAYSHYLYGRTFIIQNDNSSIQFFKKITCPPK